MSVEGEDAISLSDAESEGDGPGIKPPQATIGLATKHKQKKRKRSRESSKHERRSDDRRDRKKNDRDYDRRRDRDRSRNDVDIRRDRDDQDLRNKIVRERYDRDRDNRHSRDSGERRHYERDNDKRRDRNPEQEERKNRILMAVEEKRKEAEARKKTKLLEKEMERLQQMLKRKKAAERSRSSSRTKSHKKKKKSKKSRSESSDESDQAEADENKQSDSEEEAEEADEAEGSTEGEEESDSDEDSESDSDSTASQKSEETPDHDDNSSEDGEVEDEEDKKLEALVKKSEKKSSEAIVKPTKEITPKKSPTIGGKWADKSPEETPSRSPTPLREESDHTPGHGSGTGSRIQSPAPLAKESNHDSPAVSPTPLKDDLPPYQPSIHGCRNVAEFKPLNRIEEGTYGVVYRAKDLRTQEIVALKRLKMEREKEGFPITSLREVNTLLISQHPNVVTVREIVVGSNCDLIYIVMDFVQHDLKSLMELMRKKNQVFLTGEVKCLMVQLLRAIAHLHDNWILHRDLKASNLLLSHEGILKVGDFGLAREYGSPLKAYTSVVVTLWYRAPELLLGIKEYSTYIDVWSIGCIFGELLLMEPLFPGKSEVDELNRIFKLLGTPSETTWPGYKELPRVQKMKFVDYPIDHLRQKFPESMLSETGLQFLKSLLCYDPRRRVTCETALESEYFREDPRAIHPNMFPTWPAKSEQEPGDKVKKNSSPKPPPGGGMAFKDMGDDDDERAERFSVLEAANNPPPVAGWNLKF